MISDEESNLTCYEKPEAENANFAKAKKAAPEIYNARPGSPGYR
jgi:hypothetical protein